MVHPSEEARMEIFLRSLLFYDLASMGLEVACPGAGQACIFFGGWIRSRLGGKQFPAYGTFVSIIYRRQIAGYPG